ncbi:MAG: ATP-dependent protease LonB [Candidatus Thermoplasmatota archaeon]|nr:ATP-dependent protease LonB [Candidatus Thermoplasmatota archaeon]MBU1940198.1 ATP-dependent protease LonB [Candidatus Thermoplasmatota archaeon]
MTPIDQWIIKKKFKTTEEIEVPERLIDQVIGQDSTVDIIKKSAEQKRHVMLIGDPGTGKSMVARAMTEFLPKGELEDIISYPNQEDTNTPHIRVVPGGTANEIVKAQREEARKKAEQQNSLILTIVLMIVSFSLFGAIYTGHFEYAIFGIIAAVMIYLIVARGGLNQRRNLQQVPKILVGHEKDDAPPFIDATAAHSGALLGDVRHDPFQSAGLETPPHQLVEAGAIHRAHKGVLYIDEINTLSLQSQQHLLTALQEKKFQITGQSDRSFGAMVKTEPTSCDFILVSAGNLDALKGMHPALRSRIRGYGYEIYLNSSMDDTEENRTKLIRFVAQEVKKDGKIHHFDKAAVGEIIHEAQRRAGRKGKLSLRLRELGGLVRAAGDLAYEQNKKIVTQEEVIKAKKIARSLEQQVADRALESQKHYRSFQTTGWEIGAVNGLAVHSADPSMSEFSGLVLPIVAEVTPAGSQSEGKVIATGKLGEIAKESVQNISAIIKKYMGRDISKHDIHIQFIGTYEGVEGDSASISLITAVISAMENVYVRQDVAMTGSISIRGTVLPIGGVTAKIEAAAEAGIKKVLIPKSNFLDVLIEDKYHEQIEIVPVETLTDVLENALIGDGKEQLLKKLRAMRPPKIIGKVELESEQKSKPRIKSDRSTEELKNTVSEHPTK